jgi:hypothetical protein
MPEATPLMDERWNPIRRLTAVALEMAGDFLLELSGEIYTEPPADRGPKVKPLEDRPGWYRDRGITKSPPPEGV